MSDYVNLYLPSQPKNLISLQSSDCYVLIAPAKEWTCVSFVNGITTSGGVHVDRWVEALFRPVIEKLNAAGKAGTRNIDMREIKKHFFFFVYATVVNPKYDGQVKDRLCSPNVDINVPENIVSKLLKWDFVKDIEEGLKLKEMSVGSPLST